MSNRSYATFEEWFAERYPEFQDGDEFDQHQLGEAFDAGLIATVRTFTGSPHPDPVTGILQLRRD